MSGENKCQIQRTGTVYSLEDHHFIIEVDGRKTKVPAAKVNSDCKPGDKVKWTGSQWSNIE